MKTAKDHLRTQLGQYSRQWLRQGLPSHEQLTRRAADLNIYKKTHNISSLFDTRPVFMTATLDDGIGQGLALIHAWAEIFGLEIRHLGLNRPAGVIASACTRDLPDFLGITVLQLDSEEDLAYIGMHLPPRTRFIAGGPAFSYDPDLAGRCGISYVAKNVAHFVNYMLNWKGPDGC